MHLERAAVAHVRVELVCQRVLVDGQPGQRVRRLHDVQPAVVVGLAGDRVERADAEQLQQLAAEVLVDRRAAVLLLGVAVGLRLVQVGEHRRVEDHRLQHVAEPAEGVPADDGAVVVGGEQPGLVPDRHVHVRRPDVVHLLEELVRAPDRLDDLHLDQLVLSGHVVVLLVVRLVLLGVVHLLELGRRALQQRVPGADLLDQGVGLDRELLLQVRRAAHGLQLLQGRRADPVGQPAGPVQVLVQREDRRALQQGPGGDLRRRRGPVAGLVVRLRGRLRRGRRVMPATPAARPTGLAGGPLGSEPFAVPVPAESGLLATTETPAVHAAAAPATPRIPRTCRRVSGLCPLIAPRQPVSTRQGPRRTRPRSAFPCDHLRPRERGISRPSDPPCGQNHPAADGPWIGEKTVTRTVLHREHRAGGFRRSQHAVNPYRQGFTRSEHLPVRSC